MFFKRAALLIALASVVAGCSLRFGEEPLGQSSAELSTNETKCFNGGLQTVAEIANGRASDEQISGLWNCASRSLVLFAERTRGGTPGVYSPKELRNFLHRYFLKETRVSDALLAEFMELKRTLLGGSADALTREELYQASRLLLVFRDQNLRLKPYLPLSFEHIRQMDEETVQNAVSALQGVAVEFSRVLQGAGNTYRFAHLEGLFRELEAASVSEDTRAVLKSMREFVPAVQQIKSIFVSPDPSQIASDEWNYLLTQSMRSYGLILRWVHARHLDPSLVHGLGRTKIVELIKEGMSLFTDAIERRGDRVIPFTEFDRLIDVIDPRFFQLGRRVIKPEHLKGFLRPLVRRGLGGSVPGIEGRGAQGLTLSAIRRAETLLEEWSEAQNYLDHLYSKLQSLPRPLEFTGAGDSFPRSQLMHYTIEEVLGRSRESMSLVSWQSAQRVRSIITNLRPLFRGDDSIILVTATEADPSFSYHDLTMQSGMDLLGRILAAGYAEDPLRTGTGVTLKELEVFYWDARDVGIDLKIFDPRNTTVAQKRFLEANVFMSSGDGNEILSVGETSQILSFMISTKRMGYRTHRWISKVCNAGIANPEKDWFGIALIDAGCYRKRFFDTFEANWDHMPLLRDYYARLDASKRAEFERNLEIAARSTGVSDKKIESTDSEGFSGVAHYMESVFARFDRDQSGTIGKKEALEGPDAAFETFREALEQASCKAGSCLKDKGDLEVLFTYLLAHGKVPNKAQFVWWMIRRPFWSFECDRGRMVQIMGALAQAVRPNFR